MDSNVVIKNTPVEETTSPDARHAELLKASKIFAEAICARDMAHIAEMLADDGEFNIYDEEKQKVRETDKPGFLLWLEKRLNENQDVVNNYYIDYCLHCSLGDPVIIFKDSRFLFTPANVWEKTITGLRPLIVNGKIRELVFCFTFRDTENQLYRMPPPDEPAGDYFPFKFDWPICPTDDE